MILTLGIISAGDSLLRRYEEHRAHKKVAGHIADLRRQISHLELKLDMANETIQGHEKANIILAKQKQEYNESVKRNVGSVSR
jgi:hypothetical protein